ncbi:complex I NDUFA9 subunit family protein [Paracoccus sp. 1_MG-2023]|uniref:complex I NDUFA9 subunit family protein n=1 Tax=unclassified Paracoccus (in: a-proteobacteria) TaxID=2688777 RepID=UPI001C092BF0|nr:MULTISPECIES: complex I NDUFA9 subunit family protein [unclassified Paracoccus (in: a-proteobacteria)]MBU2956254.1 complex I NDUFA9 subunit family protein [Paracoccus sp. C2R09]MDO6667931.1 complex I NDUFA9 subunit family protein [Paracoccus sp. 1_MG-2023]
MAKLVTIFGGSGFVGRQVARLMAKEGWRVRIAVRRPDEALFTRTYGAVGQVVPVMCNIRDEASVRAALTDADAAVNCVNILSPEGKSNFRNIFEEGAGHIARLSAEMGVTRLVHISGLGIDPDSPSKYVAAKSRGEAAVLKARPDAVVLRPSVIFGPGDNFYNRLAGLTRMGPLMPVLSPNTRMQPVFVEDVARAAMMGATGAAEPGIYELGGPEVMTMREISRQVIEAVHRKRIPVTVPMPFARLGAMAGGLVQTVSGGLISAPLNGDQLHLLTQDNIVSDDARGFAQLGIQPTSSGAVIEEYLWRFSPSGQYDAIKRSAKNLRDQ